MYIKENASGGIAQENYAPNNLRTEYPNTSFPLNIPESLLAGYDIYLVATTTQPSGNVVTETTPTKVDGVWTQQWTSRDYTSEETAAQLAQLQTSVIAATQAHLDTIAVDHGYDSILSACTYATSSVTRYGAEGTYCVGLRDATWSALETILGEVQAGSRAVPTGFDDISASLPAVVWPS